MSAYTELVARVRKVIRQALPGKTEIRVEKAPGNHPFLTVVSEAFEGQTLKERQDMVWGPLRQQLGAEASQISLIETYAFDEAKTA